MIPRMTTIGVLNNYRYDLNKSNNTMTKAMNTVMTGRSFFSYADDPAVATRCFQMRRSFMRTASQLDVNTAVLSKYNQAWSALDTVSQDIYDSTVTQNSTAFGSVLRSENGPDASGRNALGQSLSALAQSIVQTMNGRNGENYIFGGADTLNAPFTWGPKKNPAYVTEEALAAAGDDAAEKYPQAFQYVKEGGGLTNDIKEAAGELVPNTLKGVPDGLADFLGGADGRIDGGYLSEKSELKYCYKITEDDGTEKYITAEEYAEGDYSDKTVEKVEYYTNTTSNQDKAKKIPEENEKYDATYQSKYLTDTGKGTDNESEAASSLYFRGVPVDSTDPEDIKKMEYFMGETKYLDVGLGHKEQDSEALSSTVFNSALQGIYYLGGNGTDENGIPNNLISVINELGTILQRCDPDNGAYASDEDAERAEALAHKLEGQQELFVQRYAEIDTRSSFLRDNGELLTDTADSLAQQFMGLEDVDPADAITAYMYARYCYDAALKLGNSVLPQSLMDYMNF